MKKFLILFFAFQTLFSQQTNVQNELSVKNTSLFYFYHKITQKDLEGYEYFMPYLAYMDENNQPQDYLMDSFVLADFYYQRDGGFKGVFDLGYLNSYLNDIFVRTRLPILDESSFNRKAVILANRHSTLSYSEDIPPSTNQVTLKFNVKLDGIYVPNSSVVDDILIGWEYFDANGNKLYSANVAANYNYSLNWFEFFYKAININSNSQNISHDIPIPTDTPSTVKSIKFHIMNYDIANNSSIRIDNVELLGNSGNLLKLGESQFDNTSIAPYDIMTTKWEFRKVYDKIDGQCLFANRTPIIDEIKKAREELSNDVNLPNTKLIFSIPDFDIDYYTFNNGQRINLLKNQLKNFINEVQTRFDIWDAKPENSGIEIAGAYFIDEYLPSEETNQLISYGVIDTIKTTLDDKNWQLYGSPFNMFNTDVVGCLSSPSIDQNIRNYFDVLWQQPNAFFSDYDGLMTDSHLLKQANTLMANNKFNANIETNFFRDNDLPLGEDYFSVDGYGRVNDYFWYGEKYGYINYSKLYYDEGGLHHRNAFSTDERIRADYDNLYKFIKKARKGVVINPEFETLNDTNQTSDKFHHWTGNYLNQENLFSYSAERSFDVEVNSSSIIESEYIPIQTGSDYVLTLKAKELSDDNIDESALVGVIFYDKTGTALQNLNENTSLTNLKPHYLGNYYAYLFTNTDFAVYNVFFRAPSNAVKFKFYLEKWRDADLEFKDMKFALKNSPSKFMPIYKDTGSNNFLKVENEYDFGSNSLKLFYDGNLQRAITSEKISVIPNKDYNLELWTKELLSSNITNATDKALIGIEAYNQAGQKINLGLTIPGFQYTTNTLTPMHYRYIGNINQVWNKFLTTINFPSQVASIKIHIYNWYYGNYIHFDNLSFELTPSLGTITTEESDNLLKIDRWTEKMPLITSYQQPVIYKDLINVSDYKKLKFTAKLRDTFTSASNNDLLAIEFYDDNYNLLTDEDILPSSTNFEWSSFYKYWWDGNTFDIDSWGCNNNGNDTWRTNQWDLYEREIEIPLKVKYIRVSFQKLSDSDEDFLILNPTLVVEEERNEQILNPLYALKE